MATSTPTSAAISTYFVAGLAANMPTAPNTTFNAALVYYQTDLNRAYIWSGTAMVRFF